jgi:hypothetical protein
MLRFRIIWGDSNPASTALQTHLRAPDQKAFRQADRQNFWSEPPVCRGLKRLRHQRQYGCGGSWWSPSAANEYPELATPSISVLLPYALTSFSWLNRFFRNSPPETALSSQAGPCRCPFIGAGSSTQRLRSLPPSRYGPTMMRAPCQQHERSHKAGHMLD